MHFERELNRDYIIEAARQTHHLWGSGRGFEERVSSLFDWMRLAGSEQFSMAGLLDGTQLASSLKRYTFELSLGESVVRCVGLGAVFTEETYRRQGLAAEMIRQVLEDSRARGFGAAILYSDIDPAFYAKLGFRAAPARSFELATESLPAPAGAGLPMRRADEGDIPTLLGIYSRESSRFGVYTQRTIATWKLFHAINRVENHFIFADGAGYVSCSFTIKDKVLFIDEWMAPEIVQDAMWAALAQRAREEGLSIIRGWADPLRALPPGAQIRDRVGAIPMLLSLREDGALPDLAHGYFGAPDHF